MADTTWDDWRAAANDYAERCWTDWMSKPIFPSYPDEDCYEDEDFEDEEFDDDEEDC